ncbi:MAG: DUF4013 domain-containing protein [Methanobrevibacter sp.]|nr:DUF4013 domain-containing protein [Methanobrevibacter sp.]
MDMTKIFEDSLTYPAKNLKKLVDIGILTIPIIILIFITVISVSFKSFIVAAFFGIITLISVIIIGLIYSGYSLGVTREVIENRLMSENINAFPGFKFGENIVDGIKVVVLSIVYLIIPIIITVILAYALGLFNGGIVNQYISMINSSYSTNSSAVHLNQLNISFALVQGVYFILILIFSFFMLIAKARLAETSKLSSIFEIREIFDTVAKIGWGNYVIWFILLYIIGGIIGFVLGIVAIIPLIGAIIGFLIIIPFMIIFESIALGLIYNESK